MNDQRERGDRSVRKQARVVQYIIQFNTIQCNTKRINTQYTDRGIDVIGVIQARAGGAYVAGLVAGPARPSHPDTVTRGG